MGLCVLTIGDDNVNNSLTFASLGSYAKICILQQTETMSYNGNDLLATETNADGTTTTLSYNNLNDQIETSVGLSGGSSTASYQTCLTTRCSGPQGPSIPTATSAPTPINFLTIRIPEAGRGWR